MDGKNGWKDGMNGQMNGWVDCQISQREDQRHGCS